MKYSEPQTDNRFSIQFQYYDFDGLNPIISLRDSGKKYIFDRIKEKKQQLRAFQVKEFNFITDTRRVFEIHEEWKKKGWLHDNEAKR